MAREAAAHPRLRRAASVALWGLAVGHAVDTAVLRRRRAQLTALSRPDPPSRDLAGKVAVVPAAGSEVDAQTLAAVAHEMEVGGAEVVDLVPGDLPAERALRLLRRVVPERLVDDVMYTPGGAHEVLALHPSVTERMTADHPGGDQPDRGDLVRRTVTAQRYAPKTAVLRLAPTLRASAYGPRDRWRELEELTAPARQYLSVPPLVLGAQAVRLAAMTAGLAVSPAAAIAALATWTAQPALVFRGGPPGPQPALQPRGLVRDTVLRLPRAVLDTARTSLVGLRAGRAAARQRWATPVAEPPPLEDLFEPERDTCPWCGSRELADRLETTDLFQHKPGTFHLDECRDCGHIFQNPALSIAGLDYYYSEFYEGFGEEMWEAIFAAGVQHNRNRAEAIARVTEPRSWLDIGAGHGHFCLTARQRWPNATFDGVDMSEALDEAQRRGRIDRAFRGIFTEIVDDLPRNYDVVSMHHYLEHTREPRVELAAAMKVLRPGGHLMIEVPDPATPWSKRLGRFWFTWAQPQHLHFVACEELATYLTQQGFEVVSIQRGEATLGLDLTAALLFGLQNLARSPHLPWLPPPTLGDRAKRMAAIAAVAPLYLLAVVPDVLKDARPGPNRIGNAYRIVARAPGGRDAPSTGPDGSEPVVGR